MHKDKFVNVACACDDHYSQHCGVMICSLLENASEPERVAVFCIDGGISKENKDNLKKMVEKYGSKIEFKKHSFEEISKMDLSKHGKMAYVKIFLPKILDHLEKVIWIDSDVVVKGDVLDLSKIEIKKAIGAVSEGRILHRNLKQRLDMEKNEEYFNTGVMILNLKRFREKKYSEKISKFLIDKKNIVNYSDQDGFNACIGEDWQKISRKWNVLIFFYRKSFASKFLEIQKKEVENIINDPKAIHYITHKPWHFSTYHPEKKEYWKYLNKTPWKNYQYLDKNVKGLIKKFIQIVKFYLPGKIVMVLGKGKN